MSQTELYIPGDIRWGLEAKIMKNTVSCPEGTAPWPCGEFPFMIASSARESCHNPLPVRRAKFYDDLGRSRGQKKKK